MRSQISSNQYSKIKEIFYTALELEPEMRETFLAQIDEDLRSEVASLLVAREESNGFLEDFLILDSVQNSISTHHSEKFIGQTIGKYRIINELGRGGMGVVFLAEREDFHQQAALKLIKGGMDSDLILARFIKEREILATLEHPNIARLIDGGIIDNGTPYLVMEYVAGVSLDQFCECENLTIEVRLKVFSKICAAVAHAHRNLVIHRDLKPSNILVNEEGEPKLLDFGIAKLFSSENLGNETNTNLLALTPEYASPEQLRGEKLTTATDIYSLGIILYELLTGNRPFETSGKNLSEVLKLVCEIEPKRPSSVFSLKSQAESNLKSKIQNPKSLQGDLDNIILKALQKEPSRRYLTVEKFADDIHRYLNGLPISARPDTFFYRTEKFVKRNRISVVAALIIFMTLIGGVATTLWQAQIARAERTKAEQRFNDVRRLANSLITEFPAEVDKSATKAKELLVTRSLEYLDSLAQEANTDTLLQRELATAYEKIGDVQGNEYFANLGDTKGALKSYRKSLELREAIFQKDTENAEIQSELANSNERIGDVLWSMEDLPGTLENYRQTLAIRKKLSSAAPDSDQAKLSLALILFKSGDLLGNDGFSNLGDVKGSLENHRQALEIRESLAAKEPTNLEFLDHLLSSYTNMGNVLRLNGDVPSAEQNYRRALTLALKIAAQNSSNTNYQSGVSLSYLYLGDILTQNGKYDEAVSNLLESLKIHEKIIAVDAEDVQAQRNLAVIHRRLGTAFLKKGDTRKSLEYYRKAFVITEKQAAADPNNIYMTGILSLSYTKIGDALAQANDADGAMKNYQAALEIRKKLVDDHPENTKSKADLANIYTGIGNLLLRINRLNDALKNFDEALTIYKELVISDKNNTIMRYELAEVYAEIASAYVRQALSQRGSINDRRENCRLARQSSQFSFDIWNELKQTGTLNPINANHLEEITKEIVRCDAILGK